MNKLVMITATIAIVMSLIYVYILTVFAASGSDFKKGFKIGKHDGLIRDGVVGENSTTLKEKVKVWNGMMDIFMVS